MASTAPVQVVNCQYGDCANKNPQVNYKIPNMAFCSQECYEQVMQKRFSSAGILLVSEHEGVPAICLGSDKHRRNNNDFCDPSTYGVEIFGGARDSDTDARDTAVREVREESGIDIDPVKLRKYLTYAPVIVKEFVQRGERVYYVVFLVNISGIDTVAMKKAWQSRVLHGAKYACTEMDMCFQFTNVKGTWQAVNKSTEKPITICKYHVPVIDRALKNGYLEATLAYLPSLNKLGIWTGAYLLK